MEMTPAIVQDISAGTAWHVRDIVCNAQVGEPEFEEMHRHHVFAIVNRGLFNYNGSSGRALLHGGALLLGNQNHCYACGHSHSSGDHCVAVQLDDDLYSEIAATQAGSMAYRFSTSSLPIAQDVFSATVELQYALKNGDQIKQDEAVFTFAETVLRHISQTTPRLRPSSRDTKRISDAIDFAEKHLCDALTLDRLALIAGLSPYHFLRVFKHQIGMTPHQFILKRRLNLAVDLLLTTAMPIIDVSLAAGFGDLSTFNKTFKAQIGKTPRMLRH